MDKLKFALLSIVVLFLMGLFGYWAVATIQTGTEYQSRQELKNFKAENEDLKNEVANLNEEIGTLQSQLQENTISPTVGSNPSAETPTPAPAKIYKNQSLINELQKLVDGNVLMKLKSSGASVGTVQKFLNVYNNTSNKIDNDFGPSMEKAIIAFQKDQGITADGQVGPGTYSKMIDWLKKQG